MKPTILMLGAILSGLGLYYTVMISALLLPVFFITAVIGWAMYSMLKVFSRKDAQAFITSGKIASLLGENEDWKPFQSIQTPRILIIDDDFDVAVAAQIAFEELGCPTQIATDVDKAKELLSKNETDIVILDWLLQDNVKASQVLRELSKFRLLKNQEHHPKVVTYSSLDAGKIDFPQIENYEHIDHWQKPLRYSDFKDRSSQLIEAVGF